MKIYVDVNTTKNDYLKFQKHHTLKYIWIYIAIALLAALVFVIMLMNKNNTGQINALYAICFAVICILLLYMIINSIVKIIKLSKKEEQKPVFSYTFTKGGVHCESGSRSFELPWTNVYKVTEIKPMFLVYLNSESAFIVPKRCFRSENDIAEFRENLLFKPRKNIKKQKKK